MGMAPAAEPSSLGVSGLQSGFVLGVPLGLEKEALMQEVPKQAREVSAVLPRVACLEFSGSSQLPPNAKELMCESPTAAGIAPAVPASTLASQLWTPSPGDCGWRQLSPTEFTATAHPVTGPPRATVSRKAAVSVTPEAGNALPSVPAAATDMVRNTSGGQLWPGELSEQALRRPRSILSASPVHTSLPSKRLAAPVGWSVPSGLGSRPATANARVAAPSTVGPTGSTSVPHALKAPPNRAATGFKSLEDVLNERRREALARIEGAPVLMSQGDAMTHTLAGLAADIEEDEDAKIPLLPASAEIV